MTVRVRSLALLSVGLLALSVIVAHVKASQGAADSDSDSALDADADADADVVSDAKWDHYDLRAQKESDGTDGEMYWLRGVHISKANAIDGGNRQHGTVLIGNDNMPAPGAVDGFDVNPPQPRLRHADMNAWLTGANHLTLQQQQWIEARAAAFNALNGVYAPNQAVTDPNFAHCHQSIKDALVSTGMGGDNDARAAQALNNAFGNGPANNGVCDLQVPLDRVLRWTAVIHAHANEWTALKEHYASLRLYAANDAYDVWVLRGWLYATERARGHRVIGSTGWAVNGNGPRDIGAERRLVKMTYKSNAFGQPGPRHWGLEADTCGHVRPRAMDGNLDPLNFVPQSAVGQKFVNAAETLALDLVRRCHNQPQVRYGVYFTYGGDTVNHRRPTRARTIVDLLGQCQHHRYFGGAPINALSPLFDWDTITY